MSNITSIYDDLEKRIKNLEEEVHVQDYNILMDSIRSLEKYRVKENFMVLKYRLQDTEKRIAILETTK